MVKHTGFLFRATVISLTVLIAALLFLLMALPAEDTFSGEFPYQESIYVWGLVGLTALLCGVVVWHTFRPARRDREAPFFLIPLTSGLLAMALMALGYVMVGMWPIGDKSAMMVDMHHQYAPMLSSLREMFLSGGNLLYSSETGLGTSFLPMFGYYLASPLNFLLVLFPERLLTESILLITLLKVALSSAFFACMLQYIYRRRTVAVTTVSLLYALMIYVLAYSWNLMWLDGIMLLPLVVLFFERMMRTGKMVGYILLLALLLFSNYYIGFMVCVFLVLYFICFLTRTRRNAVQNATATLRFFIGSALAGGLVMCLLIPVYFGLMQTSAAGGTLPTTAANFSLFDLLGRHLYNVTPTVRSGNLPNIACGILSVVLLPIFATLKAIPLRRRLVYTGLWTVLAFSLTINRFDLLWHGLHAPNDLPYRFSFLYSFVLLLIAYEALLHIRQIKMAQIGATGAGLVAYLMIEEKFGGVYEFKTIYISLLLIGIYCFITLLVNRRVLCARIAYACLLLVVCAELVTGTGKILVQLNNQEFYTRHDDYVDNLTTATIKKTVEKVELLSKQDKASLSYRMEVLPRRTLVDTNLFGYRGLTLFSSSNYYETTRLMNALGYASNGVNSYMYRSFVAPIDSLLGMRYLVFNQQLVGNRHLTLRDSCTISDAETGESETYYIYENPNALSIAFLAQNPVKDWKYSYYDPYFTQQTLFSAMTGLDGSLYTAAPLEVMENGSVNDKVSPTYITAPGNGGTSRFAATVQKSGQCYIYLDCRAARSASAVVIPFSAIGDSLASQQAQVSTFSITPHEPFIIDAGYLEAGSRIQISMTTTISCAGNIYVLTLNEDYFQSAINTLKSNGLQVTEFTDSKIVGNINAPYSGVMMTTIPYDSGWSVYVDGKKVESYAISDSLLAFDLSAGQHTVEMRFWPEGLTVGLIVSGLSLVLIVLLVLWLRRKPDEDITAEPLLEPFDDEDAAQWQPEEQNIPASDLPLPLWSEKTSDAVDSEPPAVRQLDQSEENDDFLNTFYIQEGKDVSEQ